MPPESLPVEFPPARTSTGLLVHCLQRYAGRTVKESWPIPVGRLIVGRSPDCDLQLNHEQVSRHHCVILRDEYTVRVRDLGSRNGTLVNTQPARGERILQSGDVITIGGLQLHYYAGPLNSMNDTQLESATLVDH